MTRMIHLWPEEHRRREDQTEVPAVLEGTRGKPIRLYFRVPVEQNSGLTAAADPFLLAVAFHALGTEADLTVHGTVSPSLLRGLEEFQAAWCRWRPERYTPFAVKAEAEREANPETPGPAIMGFSGGLDSCCTAWRHTRGDLGRRKRSLGAAVMVHGFDIPLDQSAVFTSAVTASKAILDSIDVPLIPIACNVRDLRDDWEDCHGAALAACLHLLAGEYSTGLIASSSVYENMRLPWGSNPVTDPLLGSAALEIVHDGCELTRWEKADEIAGWDVAQRHVRVCWEGEQLDRNCGTCMRCVGTSICYAAVGRPIPASIPVPSPAEAVARLSVLTPNPVQIDHFANMVAAARSRNIAEPWVASLAELVDGYRQGVSKRRISLSGLIQAE